MMEKGCGTFFEEIKKINVKTTIKPFAFFIVLLS